MLPTNYDGKRCPGAPGRSAKRASFHGQPLNRNLLKFPWDPKKPECSLTLLEGVQGKELFPGKRRTTKNTCPGAPMKKRRIAYLLEAVQGRELFPTEFSWAPKKPEGSLHLPDDYQGRKLNFGVLFSR